MKITKSDYILLKEFLIKCDYTKEQLDYINNNFGKNDVLSILRQIYAALGMLNIDENEYIQVFNYLLSNFDLGCNILEIAGGNYPVLATYISEHQKKIGKGSITVIDPDLSAKKLGNIKLIKESFNYLNDIKNYDFIISQSPCLKIDDIVVSAIENNKQFFVTMCKCIYDRYPYLFDYFYDDSDYDPVFNSLLFEMRNLKSLNDNCNLYIDSKTLFLANYDEIKCFTGKYLIKK